MHTPTPWMQYNSVENKWIGNRDTGEIVADKPHLSIRDADARWEDNAALIVKAVNSYQAMKEALTLLQLRIGCGCAELPCAMCRYAEKAAEKALALAEGKE